jgi:hypothetical protein
MTSAQCEIEQPKGRGRPLGSRKKPGHHAGRPKGGGKPRETFDEPLWQNGRRRISVGDAHIAESLQRSSSACAIAEALKQQIVNATHVSVDLATIRWTDRVKQIRYVCLTPMCAQELIVNFDQGLREKLQPISFDLKPAIIARAGPKRRQVPEAGDLRGSGISPAADQDCSPAEKDLAENWQPQPQPGRDGALVEPVEKQKRQPRMAGTTKTARTVSKPKPDGTVPVVLGGRMPPMSALPSNRRAFGLRQARA